MGSKLYKITIYLLLGAGILVLSYPFLSDMAFRFLQQKSVSAYVSSTAQMPAEEKAQMLEAAQAYNAQLAESGAVLYAPPGTQELYNQLLNPNGDGMMAYVEVPSVNISLPVYHGTSGSVLQIAAGHLEGSSLPVGGADTHSALSGHTGLPSAKLFTDIDRLKAGDTFMVKVLGDTLTYEVDQIHTVLPDEVEYLAIEPGQDLCTLVTCTPYGINSHRLLVRGHRVPNAPEAEAAPAEPETKHKALWFGLSGAALLALIVSVVLIKRNKRRARL